MKKSLEKSLITSGRADRAVTVRKTGNPDGKGAVGFLLDWYRSEPRGVVAKPGRQVLAEFFTSMLVLSAQFKYEPAVGVANYLYYIDGEWQLSLIAPHEWNDARRDGFVGTCVLQDDMTWTIEPSDRLANHDVIVESLGAFYRAFAETLDTDLTLEEVLPFHARKLPYYQRLYANAMSRSIRGSVTIGGQDSVPAREWQSQLPKRGHAGLLRRS